MKDERFWNEANKGCIRTDVAEFIDRLPLLNRFKDEEYYKLEDALVDFIYQKREKIYREVEAEYSRDDLMEMLLREMCTYNDIDYQRMLKAIPIEKMRRVQTNADEYLSDYDRYWEIKDEALKNVVAEELFQLNDLSDYSERERLLWFAYIKEWFATHTEGQPNDILHFFDEEMEDDELRKHYNDLADAWIVEETKTR